MPGIFLNPSQCCCGGGCVWAGCTLPPTTMTVTVQRVIGILGVVTVTMPFLYRSGCGWAPNSVPVQWLLAFTRMGIVTPNLTISGWNTGARQLSINQNTLASTPLIGVTTYSCAPFHLNWSRPQPVSGIDQDPFNITITA